MHSMRHLTLDIWGTSDRESWAVSEKSDRWNRERLDCKRFLDHLTSVFLRRCFVLSALFFARHWQLNPGAPTLAKCAKNKVLSTKNVLLLELRPDSRFGSSTYVSGIDHIRSGPRLVRWAVPPAHRQILPELPIVQSCAVGPKLRPSPPAGR